MPVDVDEMTMIGHGFGGSLDLERIQQFIPRPPPPLKKLNRLSLPTIPIASPVGRPGGAKTQPIATAIAIHIDQHLTPNRLPGTKYPVRFLDQNFQFTT
jgi:hypothetical protein